MLKQVEAVYECDACGEEFKVNLDTHMSTEGFNDLYGMCYYELKECDLASGASHYCEDCMEQEEEDDYEDDEEEEEEDEDE